MLTDDKISIAKEILKNRFFQICINQKYKEKEFKIPIHLALGHESIAVAINKIMTEKDNLILSHRNIAYNLARLGVLKPILDEYLLAENGLMNGKLGSMNLINPNQGIVYTSSILGNNFSVSVGVSLSQKIRKYDGITIVLGGDGSIEEGSFHESLLMLKTLDLSTLVIIENNEWSMHTKISERRHSINLQKFCNAYDIKYVKLEGNNVFEYIETLESLRKDCLATKSPICIEVMITTLGDWTMKTPEFPNGKFINYHAGPSPNIDLSQGLLPIRKTNEDPIYVLENIFGNLDQIKKEVLSESENEL
jgi:acetoin:2,6-dichlorophenolindophenol oxidoreductase subunit alpha